MRKVSQIKAFILILILFLAFQNCSQGFNQAFESQSGSASTENSQSSNDDSNPPNDDVPDVPNPPSTPPPTTPPVAGVGISQKYANDQGIETDAAVLFHSNFENGMTGWSSYSSNQINNESLVSVMNSSTMANGGSRYMQARVTKSQLSAQQYISAYAQISLSSGVDTLYTRYYAKIVGQTAHPHHWVRFGAGNHYDGLANTVPSGNNGFWYDLDLGSDGLLNFYVYWHQMRSGRCNDGSVTPGCAGDQGSTYYYGNTFRPKGQTALPRDQWVCIETMTKSNAIGQYDGALALWVNGQLIQEYKQGAPSGNWLRDQFFTWGNYFNAATAKPFEGFNFRTSASVQPKRVTLDAYYERGSLAASAPEAQVIHYDDVVLATQRIGCKTP